MAFGITKSRPSPIAIDFGADSLKCLQIVPGLRPPSWSRSARRRCPNRPGPTSTPA